MAGATRNARRGRGRDGYVPLASHDLALDRLAFAVRSHSPVTLVTGANGTGKTTVVREFWRRHGLAEGVAYIPSPLAIADDVYTHVLAALRRAIAARDVHSRKDPAETLMARPPTLIVDDAQEFTRQELGVLMEMLGPGEPDGAFKLVLVGEPGVIDRVRRDWPEAIGPCFEMEPLGDDEIEAFIAAQIEAAADRGRVFTAEEVASIRASAARTPGAIASLIGVFERRDARAERLGAQDTDDGDGAGPDRAGQGGADAVAYRRVLSRGRQAAEREAEAEALGVRRVLKRGRSERPLTRPPTEDEAAGPALPTFGTSRATATGAPTATAEPGPPPAPRRGWGRALVAAVLVAVLVAVALQPPVARLAADLAARMGAAVDGLQPAGVRSVDRALLARTAAALAETPVEPGALLDRGLEAGDDGIAVTIAAFGIAAALGDDRAAHFLAQMFETGDGVATDFNLARVLYRQAAGSRPRAEAALARLGEPRLQGAPSAPRPILAATLSDGSPWAVWTSGDGPDPEAYRVEIRTADGARLVVDSPGPALALGPGEVEAVRIAALLNGRSARTPWLTLAPAEPVSSR